LRLVLFIPDDRRVGIRRVLLIGAVVIVAGTVVPIVKPWKAPESSTQAGLAEHDSVWTAGPRTVAVRSRYVVLADASWVPWGDRTTAVGRWYQPDAAGLAVLRLSWAAAAGTTGWTPSSGPGCAGRFAKRLGKWPAVLTIAPDATGSELGVSIAFPNGGNGGRPLCTS
jgi:hypothetical protein